MVDFKKLSAPFPPEKVSWRVGATAGTNGDRPKGIPLAYIDARDVMERLDEVCGPDGWQCRYSHADGQKTVCELGIKVSDEPDWGPEWLWKANGAGDSDIEAEKGALSDAFKRAAVLWGIGRYLYDIKAGWVDIVPAGKSWKLPDHVLDDLMSKLGAQSARITGLPGLAKTPGKFWESAKLLISLKNEYAADALKNGGKWSDDAKKWWKGKFSDGLEKAPTEVLLGKYWADNEHIIKTLSTIDQEALREAYDIRVQQHQQFKG